jgi:hypothetical protein
MDKIKIKRFYGTEEEFEVRDRREGMYQVDDAYLNGWARKCGVYATAVYNVLCRHSGRDQSCFPSGKLIADKLHISTRQVSRALRILESHNIIVTEDNSGGKNKYWLINKSEWKDPPPPPKKGTYLCKGPVVKPRGMKPIQGGPAKQLRRNREKV